MILPSQRPLFHLDDKIVYLNCAYRAPMLKSVFEAGSKGLLVESQPWKTSGKDFFIHAETLRGLFAELIKTSADNVALVPSVSYGIQIAAANIPISAGSNIVVLEEQYPSNIYAWRDAAKTKGAELKAAKRSTEGDWTAPVLEAIDKQTAIVALPNCHWTDGSFVDLKVIAQKVRSVGAALVLDVTQSMGASRFDLSAIQPDFLVAAGYKWLLGPYTVGYLYASEKWHNARPLEFNWKNREGSEDFSALVKYRDGYQKGARRFDFGESSQQVLLPMAVAALQQILKWGVENIADTLQAKTDYLCRRLSSEGYSVPPLSYRMPHMLGVRLKRQPEPTIVPELASHGFFVSLRGASIRVSPHLHTLDEELDRFVDKLVELNLR